MQILPSRLAAGGVWQRGNVFSPDIRSAAGRTRPLLPTPRLAVPWGAAVRDRALVCVVECTVTSSCVRLPGGLYGHVPRTAHAPARPCGLCLHDRVWRRAGSYPAR